jgi:protein involved in polysaccharide export with SLBB domain
MMDGRLTITEVAKSVGVTARTIMRWEKTGKIKKPKRDWRGWRFYYKEDLAEIKRFYETSYEYDESKGAIMNLSKGIFVILIAFIVNCSLTGSISAETAFAKTGVIAETQTPIDININLEEMPYVGTTQVPFAESVKYTLGPDDIIAIEVRRHPEFSGEYTINSEEKIEYKFVGDIIVSGLTKLELKERLIEILSEYIREPEIDVTIVAYLSKVFYVVGEVHKPGKFFMRGNTVTVREALIQAGLPTEAASMRKCRLITPNSTGKNNYVKLNVCKLLYEGDLSLNLEMGPGDVLYVPSTVSAKLLRVLSPVTALTGNAAGVAKTGAGF